VWLLRLTPLEEPLERDAAFEQELALVGHIEPSFGGALEYLEESID
jgi:hypothetical protein